MPAGFAFPVDHQFWIAFRLGPVKYAPWRGPQRDLFGRLAPGATIEQAQAELTGTGRRIAGMHPDRPALLQPVALSFPASVSSSRIRRWWGCCARRRY
jgi:putative ABC transport system permease protein